MSLQVTSIQRMEKEVMELLSELNKEGTTIVMVTHSQHDAGFAKRIINLFDGQVVTEAKFVITPVSFYELTMLRLMSNF